MIRGISPVEAWKIPETRKDRLIAVGFLMRYFDRELNGVG